MNKLIGLRGSVKGPTRDYGRLFNRFLAQALNCEEEGIAAVFKSLDGVIKELAEDEPKAPVLALPAP